KPTRDRRGWEARSALSPCRGFPSGDVSPRLLLPQQLRHRLLIPFLSLSLRPAFRLLPRLEGIPDAELFKLLDPAGHAVQHAPQPDDRQNEPGAKFSRRPATSTHPAAAYLDVQAFVAPALDHRAGLLQRDGPLRVPGRLQVYPERYDW